jgi:hypothetical protein
VALPHLLGKGQRTSTLFLQPRTCRRGILATLIYDLSSRAIIAFEHPFILLLLLICTQEKLIIVRVRVRRKRTRRRGPPTGATNTEGMTAAHYSLSIRTQVLVLESENGACKERQRMECIFSRSIGAITKRGAAERETGDRSQF